MEHLPGCPVDSVCLPAVSEALAPTTMYIDANLACWQLAHSAAQCRLELAVVTCAGSSHFADPRVGVLAAYVYGGGIHIRMYMYTNVYVYEAVKLVGLYIMK